MKNALPKNVVNETLNQNRFPPKITPRTSNLL